MQVVQGNPPVRIAPPALSAQRPVLLLTFRHPLGRIGHVDRYETRAQAEAVLRERFYATDPRIESAP